MIGALAGQVRELVGKIEKASGVEETKVAEKPKFSRDQL